MATVPLPASGLGRGAWTKVSKPNGNVYYTYIDGKTPDGSTTPDLDANWKAVNLGVKAIQDEINARGYKPALVADGVLGPKSLDGIKWIQTKLGLKADGQIGSTTAKELWRRQIKIQGEDNGMDPKYLWGFMSHESTGDPGAVGYTTPSDRGLVQINVIAHSDITPEQAHDPAFAFNWACEEFLPIWKKYGGKGPDIQEAVAIANHNSPASARTWYNTGSAPNDKIADYVSKVRMYAQTW